MPPVVDRPDGSHEADTTTVGSGLVRASHPIPGAGDRPARLLVVTHLIPRRTLPRALLVAGTLVAALAAGAVAQSPAVSSVPAPGGVDGTSWALRDLVTGGTSTPVAQGSVATLGFVDGVAGGSAGCNQFSAPYTLETTTLVFGPVTTTRTGCDEAGAALATSFLTGLSTVASFAVADDSLTLMDSSGAAVMTLLGAPMPHVEGAWTATSFHDGSATATLPTDAGLTFAFTPDGRVQGNGGCNKISGPFGVSGSDISIGPLMSTTKSCGPEIDAREQRYMTALQTAMTWAITPGKLELRDYDGNLQVGADGSVSH